MVIPTQVQRLLPDDKRYPAALHDRLGGAAVAPIFAFGSLDILPARMVALICSISCPGSIVIKTFDAIRELRDAGVVLAGGFHSPMERECLEFLLRGEQPVIICPARGIGGLRAPDPWPDAIAASRLLLLSPFADEVTRTTETQAQTRNQFVAALASAVLIPHASAGGKAEAIAHSVVQRGQPLYTFDDDENATLLHLGARLYKLDEIKGLATTTRSADQ